MAQERTKASKNFFIDIHSPLKIRFRASSLHIQFSFLDKHLLGIFSGQLVRPDLDTIVLTIGDVNTSPAIDAGIVREVKQAVGNPKIAKRK